MSNEFQFEVAAFHHAHESYLVPDVLKRAYGENQSVATTLVVTYETCSSGKPPASAMFSTFSRYKREAYRHSEFAPRVLADNGLDVVMKVTLIFPYFDIL